MSKTHSLLPIITGLFVATLLISNNMNSKIFHAFGLDLPCGVLIFPLAYVFGDVLTEVYGYTQARHTIWTGFAALVLMIVSYEIAIIMPPAMFWKNGAAFDSVFLLVPRITAASIVAYLCGEFVNSYIVAKMKVAQSGKRMWLRLVASTIGGQAVDTVVFVLVAFIGTMALGDLFSVFLSGWAVKVAWELIALPITLPLVRWIKRVENEDVYDKKISFNPFKV